MPEQCGDVFRIGGNDGAWRLIVPVFVKNSKNEREKSYALLDGGSTRHVIARSLCEKLKIEGEEVRMSITTLDNKVEGVRRVADVDVEGVNGVQLTLSGAIFGDIVASGGDAPPSREDVVDMAHLNGISFPAFADGGRGVDVGVIIGAEHAHVWMAGERRQGPRGLPMGVATTLGWGLIGPK